MAEKVEKTLSAWRLELQKYGKPHWKVMYESFLGFPVSVPSRFYRSLNLYGDWAMFEAILATSTATIEGDPLNYVLKVCHVKWKEAQQDEEEEAEEVAKIDEIKKASQKQNEALEKRLKKSKKK